MKSKDHRFVPALRVRQWLRGWNSVNFSESEHRGKPQSHFYLLSIPADELRALCGVSRRDASKVGARADDLGIQRQHEEERSEEIRRFVEFGYPWSTIGEAKRRSADFNDLRKPGWLPTAVVVNIVQKSDERRGAAVADNDLVTVHEEEEALAYLELPYKAWSEDWQPTALPPLEVIDGQHRLFAFGDGAYHDFDLPVVAFNGLDVSWQAYLFYTINIKPKRINPSLAFDLYPLLRSEDWLDRAEGHSIYRETRSQELTESLWSHPESPWYDRINMLGDRQSAGVSQSAWIKSLMSTFIRPWLGRSGGTGGLFGSRISDSNEVLGWSRAQQAAFLITAWQALRDAVGDKRDGWAKALRDASKEVGDDDPAFYGPFTLISTDQGVRGYLHLLNDLFFVAATRWKLQTWKADEGAAAADEDAVSRARAILSEHEMYAHLSEIASIAADFDWRTSSAPSLSEQERTLKLTYRGSSGYKEIRRQLIQHFVGSEGYLSEFAELAKKRLS